MIKITKNQSNQKKIKKKATTKDNPKKTLQKKAKKLGAKYLDYSKRKNNKYIVEYEGKKIHFGSTK